MTMKTTKDLARPVREANPNNGRLLPNRCTIEQRVTGSTDELVGLSHEPRPDRCLGTAPQHTSFAGNSQVSEKLSASVSANYVQQKGQGRPLTGYGESVMSQFTQWFHRQLDMDRLRNYINPDGTQRTWNRNSPTDPAPNYFDNPFWERYQNVQETSAIAYS